MFLMRPHSVWTLYLFPVTFNTRQGSRMGSVDLRFALGILRVTMSPTSKTVAGCNHCSLAIAFSALTVLFSLTCCSSSVSSLAWVGRSKASKAGSIGISSGGVVSLANVVVFLEAIGGSEGSGRRLGSGSISSCIADRQTFCRQVALNRGSHQGTPLVQIS
jgi:hypothetical protein